MPAGKGRRNGGRQAASAASCCVSSGVTVVIDNEDELRLLVGVARGHDRRPPVAFRLAPRLPERMPSRFGLEGDEIVAIASSLPEMPLQLAGVHFRLDGYAAGDRMEALGESVELVDALRGLGHRPTVVDMGGGIPMSYLDDGAEWDRFWREHREAVVGDREPLTFEG